MARIPNTTWRAGVRSEAARLEAELDRTSGVGESAQVVRDQIALARKAAVWPGFWRMLWRWGSGSDIETAWRSLHMADQALLEFQDSATVLARAPEIRAAVNANLPPDDKRVRAYSDFLDRLTAEELANNDRGVRERLRTIKRAADSCSDVAHSDLRNYRNWLLITGVVLLLALLFVGIWHAFHPHFFRICGQKKPCAAVDLLEIEAAGALGGLVAGVFALRRLEAYGGPYALPLWQALLRVPAGAAGALLGVFIMQSGVIDALKPQPDSALIAYALLFGYAPDFVLRLLDEKANSVGAAARTKNDPSGTAT